MIHYAQPTITRAEKKAVNKVLDSKQLTQGSAVKALEDAVCELVGSKYAIAYSSGTTALYAASKAIFDKDAGVATSPITFIATLNALWHSGVRRIELFGDAISTRQAMPVHLAGQCSFATKYNTTVQGKTIAETLVLNESPWARIIEDACHALGSEYQHGFVGNCHLSDACVFSTHAIKNVATGEGGIITTNSPIVAEGVAAIRDHGRVNNNYRAVKGWNFRMTDIQAAIGLAQLKSLISRRAQRQVIFEMYSGGLKDTGIRLPEPAKYPTFWHLYIIQSEQRDHIRCELAAEDIESRVTYPPVYHHPAWRDYFDEQGSFNTIPWADDWGRRALALPMHNNLLDKDIIAVVEAVKKAVG